jgi:hypothetical protein
MPIAPVCSPLSALFTFDVLRISTEEAKVVAELVA